MGSVTITHLIGTVALMAIFLSVGSYYTMSISALRSQVIAVQLGGIANYVGSDLVASARQIS
jgi:putative flippase GtrA